MRFSQYIQMLERIPPHKTSLTLPLFIRCLYQDGKVNGHVFVLEESTLTFFHDNSVFRTVPTVWYLFVFFHFIPI